MSASKRAWKGANTWEGRGRMSWNKAREVSPQEGQARSSELRPSLWESSRVEQVINSGCLSPGPGLRESLEAPENTVIRRRGVTLTERSLDLGPVENLSPVRNSCDGKNGGLQGCLDICCSPAKIPQGRMPLSELNC